jgi:hypothetical protein
MEAVLAILAPQKELTLNANVNRVISENDQHRQRSHAQVLLNVTGAEYYRPIIKFLNQWNVKFHLSARYDFESGGNEVSLDIISKLAIKGVWLEENKSKLWLVGNHG